MQPTSPASNSTHWPIGEAGTDQLEVNSFSKMAACKSSHLKVAPRAYQEIKITSSTLLLGERDIQLSVWMINDCARAILLPMNEHSTNLKSWLLKPNTKYRIENMSGGDSHVIVVDIGIFNSKL